MSTIIKFIKKLVFSFLYIIGVNLILVKLGFNIPISIFSISIVYFFKLPGIILLFLLSRW